MESCIILGGIKLKTYIFFPIGHTAILHSYLYLSVYLYIYAHTYIDIDISSKGEAERVWKICRREDIVVGFFFFPTR